MDAWIMHHMYQGGEWLMRWPIEITDETKALIAEAL